MNLDVYALVNAGTTIRAGGPRPDYPFVEIGTYTDQRVTLSFESVADLRRLHDAIGAALEQQS